MYGKFSETPRDARRPQQWEARDLLGWMRRIQQQWTCSRAYRSGVEPPLPRLYTAGPVRGPHASGLTAHWSFLLSSHWHPGAVCAALVSEVVSLVPLRLALRLRARCCFMAWDQDSVGITELL